MLTWKPKVSVLVAIFDICSALDRLEMFDNDEDTNARGFKYDRRGQSETVNRSSSVEPKSRRASRMFHQTSKGKLN